jgi:hypothetical protein
MADFSGFEESSSGNVAEYITTRALAIKTKAGLRVQAGGSLKPLASPF